ncbi:MAG: bifunctional folylpolyglutamate synthase/dihydrofolate synthase [Phycisphaeraceae bacterium]|nr:bifunctional folylpolyglutamate synthase/dihydrofolate synthase [Phycisphaeraceae bacterium]
MPKPTPARSSGRVPRAGAKAPGSDRSTPKTASRRPAPAKVRSPAAVEPKPIRNGGGGAPDLSTYPAVLRWLYDRTDIERMRVVRLGEQAFKLDRMRKLLDRLGNPQQQIKSVHVAGTVGKGSTVAMIASMLEECGYTVGQYTSPHLVELRERITINGKMVGKSEFCEHARAVAKAIARLDFEPTFFEVMTAIAFKHFMEQAVDIAVVEVGLGGRLDSTNVLTPLVTVITQIDFDHTKILGNTLADIAKEKAGIFKQGVPAIVFEPQADVERVFRETAEKCGAILRIVNKDIEYSSRFCTDPDLGPHTRVCLYTRTSRLEHLPVPLQGEHQAGNCGLALAAVDTLKSCGFDCPDDRMTAGLMKTRVPGRMQLLGERPRLLVDGAHNPASMTALMRCVGAHVPYDSMVCVFGCCADKDVPAMLDRVNLGADKVIFTRAATTPRAADPDELQKMFAERSGKMSQVARTLPEALALAHRAVSRDDLIVVTGSFYLVGETIKHLQHERSKVDA